MDTRGKFITNEQIDLRKKTVQYMYDMANIKWTASKTMDYTGLGAPSLLYEAGQTYFGMVYNNNRTGLENFKSQLNEQNVLVSESTDWNTSVGNSCSTAIAQAWRQTSPSVEFDYCVNMLPYYKETGVLAVGNVNWEQYDQNNTTVSVLNKNDREVIYEAYALGLPGDALIRYLGTGGHALMITKAPKVIRTAQGHIDPEGSYVFLTDQNNRLHMTREYPSSWEVDHPIKFSAAYKEGYLPITTKELREGRAPVPIYCVQSEIDTEKLSKGKLTGVLTSNYAIHSVYVTVLRDGKTFSLIEKHPYTKTYDLSEINGDLPIRELKRGNYQLTVEVRVGLGEKKIIDINYSI